MSNPCSGNWARAQGTKPWRTPPNAAPLRPSLCDVALRSNAGNSLRDAGSRHESTNAEGEWRWNHSDELRHGKLEWRDRDGSVKCHCAESRIVSWQMRRIETQK